MEFPLKLAGWLVGLTMLAGCASTPAVPPPVMPTVALGPLIPSPPGGGCPPFESLVSPGLNRPETPKLADTLFSAGYIVAKVENGRTIWRCGRTFAPPATPARPNQAPMREFPTAQVAPTAPVPPLAPARPMPQAVPSMVTPAQFVSAPAVSAASAAQQESAPIERLVTDPSAGKPRPLIERLLPERLIDRAAWAADILGAFDALNLSPTTEYLCATMAIIGQESGFQVDPIVPGLAPVAWREIDKRRGRLGIPRFVVDAAMALRSPDGRTYKARIDAVRTERELSAVYEDFILQVPLGNRLFGHLNPIRTLGSMQVGIDFIEAYARQRPYPSGSSSNLRAVAFSRRGGIYFGTAHLLDYAAPYETPLYRFADYNAGRYASRNAALQNAIAQLSGIRLALDGVLLLRDSQGKLAGETLRAALSLGPQIGLDQTQIAHDLQSDRSSDLDRTELYRRVFRLVDNMAGTPLPRAMLPQIKLAGPKIQRNYLTTAWFAHRVESRYRACLARDAAATEEAQKHADKAFLAGWQQRYR